MRWFRAHDKHTILVHREIHIHDYNYYHYSMSAVIKMKAVILGMITMVTEAYMYVMII